MIHGEDGDWCLGENGRVRELLLRRSKWGETKAIIRTSGMEPQYRELMSGMEPQYRELMSGMEPQYRELLKRRRKAGSELSMHA